MRILPILECALNSGLQVVRRNRGEDVIMLFSLLPLRISDLHPSSSISG